MDGIHIKKIKMTPGNSHEISRKAVVRKTHSDNRDKSEPKDTPNPTNSGMVTDFLPERKSQNNNPKNICTAITQETKSESVRVTPAKNASAPMGNDVAIEARRSFFRLDLFI
jgi:hypothetical protein